MNRIALITIATLVTVTAFGQKSTKLNANFNDLVAGKTAPNVKITGANPSVGRQILQASPIDLPAPNGKGVPEPATMATLAIGIAALVRRKRNR